jgi:hypothetical protein
MVRCKAHEILRNEAGLVSAAVTKDEWNAADGRFSTASQVNITHRPMTTSRPANRYFPR